MKLRILIACEFSGVVRRAFRELGHDAWSCDLIESDGPPDEVFDRTENEFHHFCEDAVTVVNRGLATVDSLEREPWDCVICHPPCTFLANSGVRWLSDGKTLNKSRHAQMREACDFFAALYHAPCPCVAVENPVMHGYARDYLASAWKVPAYSQSFQPWQHGEPEVKRTCLWLRGLPPLVPSRIVSGRTPRVHHASPGPERWKERSRTLPGIARAMARQWSEFLLEQQSGSALQNENI